MIYKKAGDRGVTLGFHEVPPTIEKIQTFLDRGLRFIACGLDTVFILEKSLEFTHLVANNSKR